MGRFAQSELHYKKAIKANPKDPKVWNDAGYSYYLQSRWPDAERTLKTAQRLSPEDPRVLTNLGLTLAAAGRPNEALPLLSQFNGDAIGHANLGYLLAATGQVELARQQYHQALARRPNLVLAQRALAKLESAGGTQTATVAHQPAASPRTADATVRRTSSPAVTPPPAAVQRTADPTVRRTSVPPPSAKIPPPKTVAKSAIRK